MRIGLSTEPNQIKDSMNKPLKRGFFFCKYNLSYLESCVNIIDMAPEFQTKKLTTETLGEYLSDIRKGLGLTLEQVAQNTGIYEKFLHLLETGDYKKLPPDVYVLGFLKKLSVAYAVPLESLQEQYRKERGIMNASIHPGTNNQQSLKEKLGQVSITPKLLTAVGGGLVGFIALFYIIFQIFTINRTPRLEVFEPSNEAVVNGTSVLVKGKTDLGAMLSINGQNVLVQNDGTFETTAGVAPGQAELRIDATNKFGKKNLRIVSIRVDDPSVAGLSTSVENLELILNFTQDTTLIVSKDGVTSSKESVTAQSIKTIIAKESIVVTTGDAGNTKATLNGKDLGALGKLGQSITVPFSRQAKELIKK